MTQSHTFRNLFAVSAIAGAAAIALFGQSGQASASAKVLDCRATTRASLVLCCSNEVRRAGLPEWMRVAGTNCQSAGMICKANMRRCYYLTNGPILIRDGGGSKTHDSGRSTKGKY